MDGLLDFLKLSIFVDGLLFGIRIIAPIALIALITVLPLDLNKLEHIPDPLIPIGNIILFHYTISIFLIAISTDNRLVQASQ